MQRSSTVLRRLISCALVLPLFACGGGDGGSSDGPTGPTVPPTTGSSVQVTVFYDENANGQLDSNEVVRIPGLLFRGAGVAVVVGSHLLFDRTVPSASGVRLH